MSDAVILESNDGVFYLTHLPVLVAQSGFYRDLVGIQRPSPESGPLVTLHDGNLMQAPVVQLPRVTSVALAFVLELFHSRVRSNPPPTDYVPVMELSVVVENMCDIIEAADHLMMSRKDLAEWIGDTRWPQDFHYERFAIVCALYPSTELVEEAAYGTLAIPLRGKAFKRAKGMMGDTIIFGDFLDRLVEVHKEHEAFLDGLDAKFLASDIDYLDRDDFQYSTVELEESSKWFGRECRPSDMLPDGCYAYQLFESDFRALVTAAAVQVTQRMKAEGNTHPEDYDSDYFARFLIFETIPCENCWHRVSWAFHRVFVFADYEIEGDDEKLEEITITIPTMEYRMS